MTDQGFAFLEDPEVPGYILTDARADTPEDLQAFGEALARRAEPKYPWCRSWPCDCSEKTIAEQQCEWPCDCAMSFVEPMAAIPRSACCYPDVEHWGGCPWCSAHPEDRPLEERPPPRWPRDDRTLDLFVQAEPTAP